MMWELIAGLAAIVVVFLLGIFVGGLMAAAEEAGLIETESKTRCPPHGPWLESPEAGAFQCQTCRLWFNSTTPFEAGQVRGMSEEDWRGVIMAARDKLRAPRESGDPDHFGEWWVASVEAFVDVVYPQTEGRGR